MIFGLCIMEIFASSTSSKQKKIEKFFVNNLNFFVVIAVIILLVVSGYKIFSHYKNKDALEAGNKFYEAFSDKKADGK